MRWWKHYQQQLHHSLERISQTTDMPTAGKQNKKGQKLYRSSLHDHVGTRSDRVPHSSLISIAIATLEGLVLYLLLQFLEGQHELDEATALTECQKLQQQLQRQLPWGRGSRQVATRSRDITPRRMNYQTTEGRMSEQDAAFLTLSVRHRVSKFKTITIAAIRGARQNRPAPPAGQSMVLH